VQLDIFGDGSQVDRRKGMRMREEKAINMTQKDNEE